MTDRQQLLQDIKPLSFDGVNPDKPLVIAGPCSAESESQVLDTAKSLAKNGIKIFRAGIWKPRTKPGGFEGVGIKGLLWLQEVKKETGMLTATEVANHEHVVAALDSGVDILWIGARTSANPFAMQEIADALKGHNDVTVLVKNPVNPDIELWIGAMLRIYNAGVRRIGAIHRGFSTYGKHLFRNEPQWHIPIELHRRIPNLPILCDPSHMGGKRELIGPISQQALDMGFNGLIIESHCNPDCALSDAKQQVTPDSLNLIINTLVLRQTKQSTENLALLRQRIDECDNELLEVLSRRMAIAREIGQYKKEHNMQVVQAQRYSTMMSQRHNQAEELGMSGDFIETVMQAVHEESVRQQIRVINSNAL
ncbi:MAG: bifunctional 3-deoxy-7-phosphoheptulonate synthase/chorismate mutase type II [Sodaliphilus pleomorphus]|uniref:bifunctional 3-deoxy-7-phosphoheptulonate synthase/chorismate mutase type II n=1 Tax=Sodaliphilus pleomorphus TaxID=2606626 RepID=UPI0023F4207D|nr:bifunctional 3-deoxy-7-phosphoheptulonate synthase/chorismate mutase type II [Sodaliphilus pleomorphus]MDD7066473.1 bifunctional 3-deoxy-7-phosphoheptulonate synthase/chorismate mutase type II [Sodaliphilus pleomorphus]MDY2832655.1 bifunctional 3-deoxy-7-phosphoheptulonate synthase/chorismate mutase type II [Sodaliphilus pleomorphus]